MAVGYLRRSTDRQEQSIGDQRKAIQTYAESNGFDLLDLYIDDAISGASSEGRASFLKLIEDAKRNACPFQFVLVYDVKRFGRVDNDEAGFYRYQLRKNGIEVIYVSEGFNGDDTDDLLRPVKQWQARQELRDLSKVIIRGLLTRSEGGWWMGGTPPYGYDLAYYGGSGDFICTVRFIEDGTRQMLDAEGGVSRVIPKGDAITFAKRDRCRLVLSSPERVKLIRNIISWYLVDGLGYKGIADKLNRQGIPSPRSGVRRNGWATSTIMTLLQNPAYAGDMVWNRLTGAKFHKISEGRAVKVRGFPGKGQAKNGAEDWIVHRDSHPAIIMRTQFEQVQAKRIATARNGYGQSYRSGRGAKSPYLLSGLLYCRHCGHKWTGFKILKGRKRKDGSNVENFYYACSGYFSKGKSVCPRSVIPMDELEGFVMETIGRMLAEYFTGDNLQILRKLVAEEVASLAPDFGDEIDSVENRLSEIGKIVTNLIDNITATNREFVDKRIIELKREKAELESRLRALEAEGKKRIETEAIIEQALSMSGDYQTVFAEGTVEEKRFFIRAFLSRIELDPETRTGEVRFILLPGMQNALPRAANMANSEGNPNEKGPNGPEMSSLILVAEGRFEEEKMTCMRLDPLPNLPAIRQPSPLRNWNLFPVITLWELPINDWKLRRRRFSPPDHMIPDNLQN